MSNWPEKTIDTCLGQFVVFDDYQAELLETNGYELEVELMTRMQVKPGMTVANIGANIGFFTRLLSNLVGPTGKVHAIEPHPDNARLLRRNVNGNVTVHECAVGINKIGKVELMEHPLNSGEHSLLLDVDEAVSVTSMKVKYLVPPLDFAIIDTQGFDLAVMVDLAEKRPPKAVVEWWKDGADSLGITKAETFAFYEKMGYSIAPLGDDMNIYLEKE